MQRSVRRECNICSRECGQVWGLELGVANFIHPGSCKLRLSRKLGSTAWLESGLDLHMRNKSSQMTKDYNQFPFFFLLFFGEPPSRQALPHRQVLNGTSMSDFGKKCIAQVSLLGNLTKTRNRLPRNHVVEIY